MKGGYHGADGHTEIDALSHDGHVQCLYSSPFQTYVQCKRMCDSWDMRTRVSVIKPGMRLVALRKVKTASTMREHSSELQRL